MMLTTTGIKNIDNKFIIEVIITPDKTTNPLYPYTNTTTANQQHPTHPKTF